MRTSSLRNRLPALAGRLLLAVVLVGASSCALMSDTPTIDRIRRSGELRVAMSGDHPPLNVRDRDGNLIGLDVDLASRLAGILGVKIVVVEKPFKQLLTAVEEGDADIAMSGITMVPRRNLRVAFVGPYFVSGKALLSRSETLAGARSVADLDRTGIRIAALSGSTSQDAVERWAPSATLVKTKTQDEAIELVIKGGADAMMADYPVITTAILRNKDAGLVSVVSPFTYEPIGIAVGHGDPLFLNLVENYIRSLREMGLLEMLQAKWFQTTAWVSRLP